MMTKLPLLRWTLALCLVLAAVPASAITIQNGSDFWHTPGDGTTLADFTREPIPADFFCPGSAPFAGKIVFQGVPLATEPPGSLGNTDTIVHRLDDAVFDRDGVAVTRLQMRAMQFEGVEPLRNECGSFAVVVALHGEQPVTEMRIRRTGEDHGFFEAVVGVDVRIVFSPIDHRGLTVHLDQQLVFLPARNTWAASPGERSVTQAGFVLVDTDGDGAADTHVPATSRGFAPGWTPLGGEIVPYDPAVHGLAPIGFDTTAGASAPPSNIEVCGPDDTCHCINGSMHCPLTPVPTRLAD